MQVIQTICGAIMAVFGLLFAYRLIFIVMGLFCTKRYLPAKKTHRYAIVISARNEETVIGNLLESIAKQDYPQDKLTVFVVADNCTDRTAEVARAWGARVYERTDPERQTKGFALRFLFDRIAREEGIEAYEGYMVFDADNLLKHDYISRMNDAFDSGEKAITSYRNTKNLDSCWISANYALHWLRSARFEFRARSYLGLSCWIQGCGFLFANELVKEGWNYTTLTEDRAFSVAAIAQGICIGYQHEAQFYDEQPTNLVIAMRQRIRWAKGHLQAFAEFALPLLRGAFGRGSLRRRIGCLDLFLMTLPYTLIVLPVKLLNLIAACALLLASRPLGDAIVPLLLTVFGGLIGEHLGMIPIAAVLFVTERHRIVHTEPGKLVFYVLTYPIFSMIGFLSTIIAVFKKVTWQPIPHKEAIEIAQLEQRMETFDRSSACNDAGEVISKD